MKKINLNKRAQQEIVGFIVIVLMVVIAGVIFLSISLRPQKAIVKDDADISNFLISSARFTTECYVSTIPKYKTIEDLTKDCTNPVKKCDDGRGVCDVLNSSYAGLISKVWLASSVGAVKYYGLVAYKQSNISEPSTKQPAYLNISAGKAIGCLSVNSGQKIISTDEGVIITELTLCKGG